MDSPLQPEVFFALERTRELIDSKILWDTKTKNLFRRSVLIEILILMKYLLFNYIKYLGKRISFKDDIIPNDSLNITDVTDLISNFRDAACHEDSPKRKLGPTVMAFNETIGKGIIMQMGDTIIGSNYEDDIAFNMGQNILYLKRHIERAFQELDTQFRIVS